MEAAWVTILSMATLVLMIWGWRMLYWLWLRPKKLERLLRKQGIQGNPYRLLIGDLVEFGKKEKEALSKPINLSDDIVPRVFPYIPKIDTKHGKISFSWFGPKPRVNLTEPEQIKDVFNKISIFPKTSYPIFKLLVNGLASYEGEKWTKHRRLINPAFNLEKLKIMTPIFFRSCDDLIRKWEEILSSDESCEIDVWPFLQNLTSDVIARTSFGSSYEEGRRIFQLQREQAQLITQVTLKSFIPFWRFLPTAINRRMKENDRDVKASLADIINKRDKAMKTGEASNNDLLGILLETNHKVIEENGNNKKVGMSVEDIIEECKLFYFAGQETTSVLLNWTMVLLSSHPDWQTRAREEVFQVFGNKKPDFNGLSDLKIVTMILYEVLRLYPPAVGLARTVHKDVELGDLVLPAGVEVFIPIILLHHDRDLWGDDAKTFNPERFSDGILKATSGRVSFVPFGWGPRICIGQTFSMLEAKMAIAMILQQFSFELSPSYAHAPATIITLQPQYGTHVILHKIET